MRIFVPRETLPGEKRAAVTPETAKRFVALGTEVAVESGIGASIHWSDAQYKSETRTRFSCSSARWHPALHEHEFRRCEEDAARDRERI
jgi:NAD/NADP transhydrogenase alpha subunit